MVKGIAEQVFDGFCVGRTLEIQAETLKAIVLSSRQDEQCHLQKLPIKSWPLPRNGQNRHPFTVEAVVKAVQKAQDDLKQRSDLSEVWDMLVDYQIIQFECSAQRHVYEF